MRNQVKERKDIASVISVIFSLFTLVIVIISTMLAKYSNDISNNEREIISNKNMMVNFDEGNELNLKNVEPGEVKTVTFEISSREDATTLTEYEIYYDVLTNDFNSDYLYYSLEGETTLKTDSGIVKNIENTSFMDYDTPHFKGSIKPGEVQTYTFKVTYEVGTDVKKNELKGNLHVDVIETEK